MIRKLKAIFTGGAFVPQDPCDLPDGSEVDLIVDEPRVLPPVESDPAVRAEILNRLVERMQDNSLPANAPSLTRDALHERR